MNNISYDELRVQLKETEEIINALAGAQVDAIVNDKGVHLLRLQQSDNALRAALVSLDSLLTERTLELERCNRVEEMLRDSEEKFRATFMNSAEALLIVNSEEGRIIDVNDAFEALYGYTRQEAIGKTTLHLQLYSEPDDAAQTDFNPKGRLREFETTARKKDGEEFQASLSTNVFMVCGERHLAAAVRDITERKQAEAALRQSELRHREVFDNFLECIFLLDVTTDGHFQFAGLNPAEERATGLSSLEVAGKYVDDVLTGDTADRAISHYRRCLEVGTVIHYEEELQLPVGARYFHTNLIPVRNEAGRIHRVIGCCMDFTDLKRVQEESSAGQKLESVGTLAGGIAHDFNNLLGAIQAQAALASAELDAGSSCKDELKAIREVAMRGSEIVRQLMIYAGKEGAVEGSVDVSEVVTEMISLLKVSVTKHAMIHADLARDLPTIRASAAQVRQIVMNLITNASDAIGEQNGVIRVNTRPVTLKGESTASPCGVLRDGDYVQLEVSDTGCGMSPQTQAKLFDPFFTTKSNGRGLGLAVVQGIVRNLGGAIHFTSEFGKGTTFQVLLSCGETANGASGPANAGSEPSAAPSENATVLVVEDEDYLRQAVARMLRKSGFKVFEVADGSSAIDFLRADGHRVDLILLDMTIPGASSHDVVEEATRNPDIRVILTSAYSHEVTAGVMSLPQVHSFIRKPFRFEDLFRTLRKALS